IDLCINTEREKAKDVEWVNDSNLIIIIGLLHGTVSVGGDIYRYSLDDKNLVKIFDGHSQRKQAIKLYKVDEFLSYEELIYLDDAMIQHITKKERLPIEAVL
ncbi:DUF4652 domain-containing protein, partial [Bacillus thuringiensis]